MCRWRRSDEDQKHELVFPPRRKNLNHVSCVSRCCAAAGFKGSKVVKSIYHSWEMRHFGIIDISSCQAKQIKQNTENLPFKGHVSCSGSMFFISWHTCIKSKQMSKIIGYTHTEISSFTLNSYFMLMIFSFVFPCLSS